MPEPLQSFLNALPSVAGHPLALIGYLALIIAWVVVTLQTHKINQAATLIKDLPDADKATTLKDILGVELRKGLSADKYLKSRKMQFIFIAFCLTLAAIVIIILFTIAGMSQSGGSVQIGSIYLRYDSPQARVSLDSTPSVGTGMVLEKADTVELTPEANSENANESINELSLDILFSIYNNTNEKITIYDLQTVEYSRYEIIPASSIRRESLVVSPTNPFSNQDTTYQIETSNTASFRLRYTLQASQRTTILIFGLVVYYHNPSLQQNRIISNNLIYLESSPGEISSPFLIDINTPPSTIPCTIFCDSLALGQDELSELITEAIERHKAILEPQ
jgi:hypothetical protein